MGSMILGFVALLAGSPAWIQEEGVVDPAPPEVRELAQIERPVAKDFDALTIHRAPRPLRKGASALDWPTFMGPRQDNRSLETGLLDSWPDGGPPLLWEMDRGDSYVSPVVLDGVLIYTHREASEAHIDALDLETGRRFWRHTIACRFRGQYIQNNGPRSTPVIDDGVVYVHGIDGDLIALEFTTGRVIWQRQLRSELDVPDSFFGVISSPLVFGDLLIQNVGANGGPCVASVRQEDGPDALVRGIGVGGELRVPGDRDHPWAAASAGARGRKDPASGRGPDGD